MFLSLTYFLFERQETPIRNEEDFQDVTQGKPVYIFQIFGGMNCRLLCAEEGSSSPIPLIFHQTL